MQVKVGPTAAPGKGYSAKPAENKSMSSTDLLKKNNKGEIEISY